jgi:hypothetical protein
MWCIAAITPEYRARMYDLLDLYEEPYDPEHPVLGLDEKPKQLLEDSRSPIPMRPGKLAKQDYEYKRRDNLNTHNASSLIETFGEKEARRLLAKIEWHYTPKHGSWLNVAEIEIGVMDTECTRRRIKDIELLTKEVVAWNTKRNEKCVKINWQFTRQKADTKLSKHYVS